MNSKVILGRLKKALDIFETVILAGGVIFLAVLTFGNVIGRGVGHSIISYEELSRFIMILITFFGVSYGARRARHIRMGAVFELTGRRVGKTLIFITAAGTAALMFFLSYEAIQYTMVTIDQNRLTSSLRWPYWIFVFWVAIGFFLAGIHYVRTITKNIKEKEVWMSPEEKTENE